MKTKKRIDNDDSLLKRALVVLNGFIHDFATGCWAASVITVYWFERIGREDTALIPVLQILQKRFFIIGLLCIAAVFLTGMGRTFTYAYIGSVYGDDMEHLRRRLLIYKHIFLISFFGVGTFWQYKMIF